MSEEWLIDGYNLLHDFVSHNKNKIKASRDVLFGLLANFASAGERSVMIVLDGKGRDEEFGSHNTKSFRAVYSQALSADSYIERYLYEKKAGSGMIVVTRDRAITLMARGGGARVIGTKEFLELLGSMKKDNEDILFKHKVDGHGFNRPFEDKLRDIL